MNDLKGRVAIVTGGSRGIGWATAERFSELGATVILADVDETEGMQAAGRLSGLGGEARFVRTDVSVRGDTDALAAQAIDAYGRIDILVNNAGITRDATLRKMSETDFDRVIGVNLKGVFNCTQSVLPSMIEAGWGRLLNAASVVAINGNFGQTNYVAAKAGVIGMTKTWARELGRYGITVNAIAPGFIETGMIETVPEKVLDSIRSRTPLGRLGVPSDIADAYAFLASDRASFITGTVMNVDGGLVI